MVDENSSDQPSPNPSDGMESSLISEEELDEVLAQATSLAADLSEEVGTVEEPATLPTRSRETTAPDAPPPSVDDELAQLERLVGEAKHDIDEPQGEPPEEPAQAAPAEEVSLAEPAAASLEEPESGSVSETETGSEPEKDLSVPDFMSEFTESEEPAAPTPERKSSADLAAQVSPETGIAESGKLGVVGAPIGDEPSSPDEAVATAETPGDPEPEARKPQAMMVARKILQPLVKRGEPLARIACERAVVYLEAIDQRTEFAGDRVRQVLGWVAIATIGTAVLVYLVTMF